MAFIHKILKGGGEEFLPFALAQERKLRATGLTYASQNFAVDGATIKVRLEGNQSFIEIEGSGGGYVVFPHSDAKPDGVTSKGTPPVAVGPEAVVNVKKEEPSEPGNFSVAENKLIASSYVDWQSVRGGKTVVITTGGSRYRRLTDYAPLSRPSGVQYWLDGKASKVRATVSGTPTDLEILGMSMVAASPSVLVAVTVDPNAFGDVMVLTKEADRPDWIIHKRGLRALLPNDWTLSDRWHFSSDGKTAVSLSRPEGVIGLAMRSQDVTLSLVVSPRPAGGTRPISVSLTAGASYDVTKDITAYAQSTSYENAGTIEVRPADYEGPPSPALYETKWVVTQTVESPTMTRVLGSVKLGADTLDGVSRQHVSLDIDALYERRYGPAGLTGAYSFSYNDHGTLLTDPITGGQYLGNKWTPGAAVTNGEQITAWVNASPPPVIVDGNQTLTKYTWRSGAASIACADGPVSDIEFPTGPPQTAGRDFLLGADARFDFLVLGTIRGKTGMDVTTRIKAVKGTRTLYEYAETVRRTANGDPYDVFGSPGASQGPSVSAWLFAASGAHTFYSPGIFARRLKAGYLFSVDSKTFEDAFTAYANSYMVALDPNLLKKGVVVVGTVPAADANKKFSIGAEPNFAINPIRIF